MPDTERASSQHAVVGRSQYLTADTEQVAHDAVLRIGEPPAPSTQVRLSTRFSSFRYSTTSNYWRFTQPANTTSRDRKGKGSIMRRV